jgi:hypothetical protein
MRVRLVPRAARGAMLVAAVTTVAAGGVATPAMAATSTISVANDTAAPEQAVPVDLTFSGTNNLPGSAEVEAVVRPAGGLACQSSYQDDLSAVGTEDTPIFGPGAETVPAGQAYQVSASYKPSTPAAYQVCAWLAQTVNGTDEAVAGPATVSFTARGPQVTELTVSVPKDLMPGVVFQVGYTTQTDQQLTLFSVLKKTGGLPCAVSYELETQQPQQETTLLGAGSPLIFGGPTTSTVTVKQPTGTYLICTWVEGPNGQELDGSAITPVTVGTPAPPVGPKPGLALTKVTASRRHGVSVTGAAATGFTGRLLVTAACGSSRTKHTTTARGRRFSASLGLPGGCARARTVKLTVTWAGSGAWSKQTATRSVVIGR